ncbi:MAG: UDP-2,3-diacylglucosamine diphosphatase [Deltaproteobacteria bacterium]|nr:UDP-2,3-diacylglucosamine diphosphatase [Deltaproteobacteria bacterium]
MKTVFVADAHLKGRGDPNQAALVKFLSNLKADNLVILGDLFDFWTGANKVVEENYSTVLDELLRLKQRGAHIFYIEGNHDFSMGPFFTLKLKAKVIPDMGEASLDGKAFLLLHGDTVSMTFGYMLWRAFLRSPAFRLVTWAATPGFVWKCAMGLSRRSRTKNTGYDKGKRTDEALRAFAMSRLGAVDCVVFAHSHAPGIYQEKNGVFANPGSFAADKSYLVYEKGSFRIEKFKE